MAGSQSEFTAGELLGMIIEANHIASDDVASALFLTTPDLNADFDGRSLADALEFFAPQEPTP